MRLLIIVLAIFSSKLMAACPDLNSVTAVCKSTSGQTQGNENQVIAQKKDTYNISYTSLQGEEVSKSLLLMENPAEKSRLIPTVVFHF